MQDDLQDALNKINKKVDHLRKLQALLHGKECCEEVIEKFKNEHHNEIVEMIQESTTLDNFIATSNDNELKDFLQQQ